jgi:hypothetical protein
MSALLKPFLMIPPSMLSGFMVKEVNLTIWKQPNFCPSFHHGGKLLM